MSSLEKRTGQNILVRNVLGHYTTFSFINNKLTNNKLTKPNKSLSQTAEVILTGYKAV